MKRLLCWLLLLVGLSGAAQADTDIYHTPAKDQLSEKEAPPCSRVPHSSGTRGSIGNLTHLAVQDIPIIRTDVILCNPVSAIKPHAPCKLLGIFNFCWVMQEAV